MTFWMIILLISYLAIVTFGYWMKFLNLNHLKKYGHQIPEPFKGFIDEELLKKTSDYTLEHSRFGYLESIFNNVILIIFLFGGVLALYNSWILSFNFLIEFDSPCLRPFPILSALLSSKSASRFSSPTFLMNLLTAPSVH